MGATSHLPCLNTGMRFMSNLFDQVCKSAELQCLIMAFIDAHPGKASTLIPILTV